MKKQFQQGKEKEKERRQHHVPTRYLTSSGFTWASKGFAAQNKRPLK